MSSKKWQPYSRRMSSRTFSSQTTVPNSLPPNFLFSRTLGCKNAVKTVKRLFTKCRVSGQSEFLALLDWRNTQNEGFGTRPAQRLMGRRCKTLVPEADTLLKPRYSTEEETRALTGSKQRQQHQYNHHAKPVYSRPLPSEKNRRRGVCGGSGRLYILRLASTDNPVLSLVLKRPITKFQCLVAKDYRTTVCRCLVHRRRYSARLVCLRFGSRVSGVKVARK